MDVMKELTDKIFKADINGVKEILSQNDFKPNIYDEHGMTPLQHAAFKGSKEVVQLLLDQGADVNSGKHEHGYTALHFAALSGSTEICQLLLEQGAKPNAVNSVGRTPAQMAAFVGNHGCVTIINNFVPKSDIDYYTIPSGFETEPKLPPVVSAPLHKFIMQINLNPVRITMNLIKSPILYEYIDKVKNVLELMSQKEMKKGFETNEIMSFKFHYLSSILGEIIRFKKLLEQSSESTENSKKPLDPIELFIKKLLRTSNETPEYQDAFLKEVIRHFPNRECTIFRQMVCSLSKGDSTNALSVITSIVNGQRGFADSDVWPCATCGDEKANKKCSQCKSVQYCDRDCQKYHWFMHKKECANLAKMVDLTGTVDDEKSKQEAVNAATKSLISEIKSLKAT